MPGRARILEGKEAARGDHLLTEKYGWWKRSGDFFRRFRPRPRAFLAIELE